MKLSFLGRLEEGLIAALLAVMTLITFAQVVARYVFNHSFVWALELVTYLFAWLIFLGMSYGVRVGSHIGVDALVKALGRRAARIAGGVATALCVVYSGILLYGSLVYVAKMYQIGIMAQDLPVAQWVPRLALPIGFALMGFRFLQLFARIVLGSSAGLHLADEAAEALKLKQTDAGGSLPGEQNK